MTSFNSIHYRIPALHHITSMWSWLNTYIYINTCSLVWLLSIKLLYNQKTLVVCSFRTFVPWQQWEGCIAYPIPHVYMRHEQLSVHTIKDKNKQLKSTFCMIQNHTLFFRATDAPFSISKFTISSCLSSQAIIRGECDWYCFWTYMYKHDNEESQQAVNPPHTFVVCHRYTHACGQLWDAEHGNLLRSTPYLFTVGGNKCRQPQTPLAHSVWSQ